METETKAMSTKELSVAVSSLLEQEEARAERARHRRRRRIRRDREQTRARTIQLAHSVELIKWYQFGISLVMTITLIILVVVVWKIGNEAERIKGEVQQVRAKAENIVDGIEREADSIRDKLQRPLQTIGGAVGGQLGHSLGKAMGVDEE
ncbi:hypothetical protein [Allorhodopirellula solitaria]|uniref:Uncharacterized protein n=1 Tax=Allorhodopirellula solitaria TaxID=2527987 RepID=A0A5C5XVJ4_9BACT|nr:hypothetical protein [Allorhodopirellula solitaria]TWT66015.1 hypothetical protein CA85_28740 [Allorhodopirellula solitaria]